MGASVSNSLIFTFGNIMADRYAISHQHDNKWQMRWNLIFFSEFIECFSFCVICTLTESFLPFVYIFQHQTSTLLVWNGWLRHDGLWVESCLHCLAISNFNFIGSVSRRNNSTTWHHATRYLDVSLKLV